MKINDCIFCQIIDGSLPSKTIFSDEYCTAFEDINPSAKIHLLIVPKEHITLLADIPRDKEKMLGQLLRTGSMIAKQLGVERTGYRLIINQGKDAGQMVDHLHIHLLAGESLSSLGTIDGS